MQHDVSSLGNTKTTTCQDVSFLGRGASSLCVCSVLCEPWLTRRCQVPCTVKITVNKSLSISPIPILILPYNYLLQILISCKQSKVPDICDADLSVIQRSSMEEVFYGGPLYVHYMHLTFFT